MVGVVDRDDQVLIWITFAEAGNDSVYAIVRDRLKEEGVGVIDYGFFFHSPEP